MANFIGGYDNNTEANQTALSRVTNTKDSITNKTYMDVKQLHHLDLLR